MRSEEIRKWSDQELAKQLEEAYHELFNLRTRAATNQLTDYSQLRKARRNLARIKTIIRERELSSKT